MGIAQTCLQCGQGLSRIRPRREPHYGLSLVTCPRCSHHAVRNALHLRGVWQRVIRSTWTFLLLGSQFAIFFGLLVATVAAAGGLSFGDFDLSHPGSFRGYWYGVGILLIILPMVTGTWLTAGFRHIKRWKVYGGWFTIVGGVLLAMCMILGAAGEVEGVSSRVLWDLPVTDRIWIGIREMFPMLLGVHVLMTIFALAGIPLGRGVGRLYTMLRRWHWRWMLKRRRLRRSAA